MEGPKKEDVNPVRLGPTAVNADGMSDGVRDMQQIGGGCEADVSNCFASTSSGSANAT